MTIYTLTIHFKDGLKVLIYSHEITPKTTGHNRLLWMTPIGAGYMVNEAEISYVEIGVQP